MNNKLALLCLLLVAGTGLSGQNFFQVIQPNAVALPANAKRANWQPNAYQAVKVADLAGLSATIAHAPMEFTAAARSGQTVISVPQTDGTTEDFAIYRVMACEQGLYDRYPEIRTFAGYSLRNPARTLRGSITLRGLKLLIFQPDRNIHYLEPLAQGQTEFYRLYDRRDLPADQGRPANAHCGVTDSPVIPDEARHHADEALALDNSAEERGTAVAPLVSLRVYRMAVGCNHLFAEDHGGTKELALAAIVEYTNAISSFHERDNSIRFQLVANTDNVVFADAASDLYVSGGNVPTYAGQNGVILNGFIGINNYDIGHVLSHHVGDGNYGIASLSSVCAQGNKAFGSSSGNGNGDYGDFFLNTYAHEVGHQVGCGHTWNHCGGNVDGRSGSSAWEPGSGTTIMSYGGICGPIDNVINSFNNGTDLIFHVGSVEEARFFVSTPVGSSCGTVLESDNHLPTVSLTYTDGFNIPISTPFELIGSAADEDGDSLSYTWETIVLGPATELPTPLGDSPTFRNFAPNSNLNRVFPKMSTVLSNGFDRTEQLTDFTRKLKFRFVAHDNRSEAAGLAWAQVNFNATALAGPFLVSSPNASTDTWQAGEYRNVEWDVANTNAPPVNCLRVNIRLSTDGGQTWPFTLASNVTNDGNQVVLVPNVTSNQARIRVDAADNVFFDVSNANFKIVAPTQAGVTAGLESDGAFVCLPDVFTTEVKTAATGGFNNPIALSISNLGNLPAGATASLSASSVTPGQSAMLTVDLSGVANSSTFSIGVLAEAQGVAAISLPLTLTTSTNDFSAFALQQPTDGSLGLEQTQILRWSTAIDATSYDVQLATSPSFAPETLIATELGTALDSFKIPTLLAKKTGYYWRVRPNNVCSPHPWSEPFFFSTLTENCSALSANDLPKNISANNVNTIDSKINVGLTGTISDINVSQLKGFHDYFGDLDVRLASPSGTEIILFKNRCDNYSGNFNFGLDDNAPNAFACPPPNNGNINRPQGSLASFIGQQAAGNWTLKVKDSEAGSGGTLEAFQLEFCTAIALNPPYLVNNNLLTLASGTNKLISSDFLQVDDANNSHGQLTYTLVTVPEAGVLDITGIGTLEPGDQFTQADIDGGLLRYFDYGFGTGTDCFRFVVSDGEGGFLGTLSFCAQPLVSGTNEPINAPLEFSLAPNPASDAVTLTLGRLISTEAQVQVYSTDGRLVSTQRLAAGQERLTLSTANWPRGMYFTQVTSPVGSAVRKLMLR